ncbi:MAG TPA: MaoC family dehydratase N-terminal domain-containing protein [Mycobacteriales bacterium]|nr:MaoC family dehydratase N-terminal domain-containing protein [Mycobacteriales bacterium]
MPLNRDFIGRTRPSGEPFEVTRNDIRRFAKAIGDDNPAYVDPDAAKAMGHRDVVAPPTFLIAANSGEPGGGFVHDPELGLVYALVVHGEERFEFHRPVYAGDVLETVTRVADIRDAGRNELMTLVSEVTSNGEPVATVTNTIVSRGTAAPKEA